jgi:thymidylate kinase
MKILIVEGIATSGKSSLIEKISTQLGKDIVKVYGEEQTHEPIMDKTDDLHIGFFKSLLNDALKSNSRLTIFDRFHLTQAFRAKAGISEYKEIEDLLAKQNTLIAYLKVGEDAIADRIRLTAERRDKEQTDDFRWGEYFHTKGKSYEEIADYYVDQQRSQLQLLEQSRLESHVFNTTSHDYEAVANQIINKWFNEP